MLVNQWWNFFYLCGSAAVTLTGLTFIAVTLGYTLIKKETLDQVNIFVTPICYHFIHVFFLCCLTAIPGVSSELMATAAILTSSLRLAQMPKTCSILDKESKKDGADIDWSDWVTVVFVPTAIYLAMIVAGIGFVLDKTWAVDVLAASCLTLLLLSARAAWNMVIWIASTLV